MSKEIILGWVIVFLKIYENIIVKRLLTKSTSDSFFYLF